MTDRQKDLLAQVRGREIAKERLFKAECALESLGFNIGIVEEHLTQIGREYSQNVRDAISEYLSAKDDFGTYESP
jgi:hypothetical protein